MAKPITKESLKTYTKFNIDLGEELDRELKKYILLNDNKPTRNEFIKELVERELDGLVLDNSFIRLEKPFYFHFTDLIKHDYIKANNVPPIYNREGLFIVYYVPNNLDSWEADLKTYCSERIKTLHRGLLIVHSLDPQTKRLFDYFVIFSYDSKEETLELSLINPNELDNYFKVGQETTKQKFLDYNERLHMNYIKDGEITDLLLNDIALSNRVISKFSERKAFKRLLLENWENKGLNFDKKVAKQLLETDFKNL